MLPLINGESYGYSSISFDIEGTPVYGVTEISYKDSEEIEDNYAAGRYAVSRGFGTIKYEGSITLTMNELEKLQDSVSTGRIQDIPEFNITVTFVPKDATKTRTHRLLSCRFKENGRSGKTGDKIFTTQIPLQIGQIKWK